MRKLFFLAFLIPATAQAQWTQSIYFSGSVDPTGSCTGQGSLYVNYTSGDSYYCNGSTWVASPSGEAGGPTTWGDITGTLSAQTDLQNALNGKEPSGTFSGVGACGANQWASTLNDGAAPTCTQPAFSNLSGSATDAQVPNNITVDLASAATALASNPSDCGTSTHFAVGVDASGVAVCEAIVDADVPNNITVDLATLATTATTAAAGDSATAFFSSGTVEVARGGTGAAPGADDQVLVADSTTAGTWRAVNDCQGAGKALTYTASSNSFGCNTISGGGGGGPVVARKSADQASTSTTFADVTGLTFSINASTTYSIVCELSYLTAATTTALQIALNGPASPTALRYTVQTATSATAMHNASQSAYDTVTNAASALTTALPVRLTGTVENGPNAGTLALRMRTEVAASSVTIQRGSWCALY
jgi:hypothetical protein